LVPKCSRPGGVAFDAGERLRGYGGDASNAAIAAARALDVSAISQAISTCACRSAPGA
jgi:hypothetical protein